MTSSHVFIQDAVKKHVQFSIRTWTWESNKPCPLILALPLGEIAVHLCFSLLVCKTGMKIAFNRGIWKDYDGKYVTPDKKVMQSSSQDMSIINIVRVRTLVNFRPAVFQRFVGCWRQAWYSLKAGGCYHSHIHHSLTLLELTCAQWSVSRELRVRRPGLDSRIHPL